MNELLTKIQGAKSIAILGHMRPDGDCVGSCLGLYNYINENYADKNVCVYLEEIPEKFSFLKGAENIYHAVDAPFTFQLAISLDCGDTDRHGEFADIFKYAEDTVCLDHHRSNVGFGNYFYCDPDASSTCEVVYRFLEDEKISKEVAECFYLGIVHDTGVFKFASTSEETMKIAGRLLSKGVNSQMIIDDTYFKTTFNQNRLCGRALLDAKRYLGDRVIVSVITKEIFDEYACKKSDTDGIIDKIRVTEGVEVAILCYELTQGQYKFSLRSVSYVDVSSICQSFGGGGHIRAAGFESKGNYEETLETVLEMIKKQLSD